MGGRCTQCGTLQFPRTDVCVNPQCRATHTQEPHGFRDEPATRCLLTLARQGRDGQLSIADIAEREGLSVRHPARFVLIGSGNPEEGELRPQLLDRFGLSAPGNEVMRECGITKEAVVAAVKG